MPRERPESWAASVAEVAVLRASGACGRGSCCCGCWASNTGAMDAGSSAAALLTGQEAGALAAGRLAAGGNQEG